MSNQKYIDLVLKCTNKDVGESSLDDAIKKYNCIVLLGLPGGGKSTLFGHFKEQNNKTKIILARDLEFFDGVIDNDVQFLLIDGFDEIRNTSPSKNKVINFVASKLKSIIENSELHIAISCREIDWFGEKDTEALNRVLDVDAKLFHIQPMDWGQKRELARLCLDDDSLLKIFCKQYIEYDFLDNPQTLTMFLDVLQDNPQNLPDRKLDVFKCYIEKFSRELNEDYLNEGLNDFSSDDIFKYSGYIAYFYFFSDVQNITNQFLSEIANEEKDFLIEKIKSITKLKLFNKVSGEISFPHRTIAEFLCARFLYREKMQNEKWSIRKILNLFDPHNLNFIASEYRGVYAWLCSLSESEELFLLDPFCQYLYGDNSLFTNENKIKVLEAILERSKDNPWFYKRGVRGSVKGFYNNGLDDDLIRLFMKAINAPSRNHSVALIADIICSAGENTSAKLKDFVKDILYSPFESFFKKSLLTVLIKEKVFLKDYLEAITKGHVDDKENELKDEILNILYPEVITPREIIAYLRKFEHNDGCHMLHSFLYKEITFEDKRYLTYELIKGGNKSILKNYDFRYYWKHLIGDYLFELANREPNELFWQEILDLSVQDHYDISDSWHRKKDDVLALPEKIKESLYISMLKFILPKTQESQSEYWKIRFYFENFENLLRPQNVLVVLENQIKPECTEFNKLRIVEKIYLLHTSNGLSENDAKEKVKSICKKFSIWDKFCKFTEKSPERIKYEQQTAARKEKRAAKIKKEIEHNEQQIANIADLENAWEVLMQVAQRINREETYSEEFFGLYKETYDKLVKILKGKIFQDPANRVYKEYTTLESIADGDVSLIRNVDELYSVILTLNSNEEFEKITDDEFVKYLYINSVVNRRVVNRIHSDYDKWMETKDPKYARNILIQFIEIIFKKNAPENFDYSSIITLLKDNVFGLSDERYLSQLKEFIFFVNDSNKNAVFDNLINNVINELNVAISLDVLKKLNVFEELQTKTKNLIRIMIDFKENQLQKFTFEDSIDLFMIINHRIHELPKTYPGDFAMFVEILLMNFDNDEVLRFHSGIQTDKDTCADFLRQSLWTIVRDDWGENVLMTLQHKPINDYWGTYIANRLYEIRENKRNRQNELMSVRKAKEYIFQEYYRNSRDFWIDVVEKINDIKKIVENNRNNEKNAFLGKNGEQKDENDCRDVILNHWVARYETFTSATKELNEGDDRVDLNIKSKKYAYEVQIECKRDSHKKLLTSIENQLCKKYLYDGFVEFGIYLVFCFENDPVLLTEKLRKTIPSKYENNIQVICIDLRNKGVYAF